MSSFNLGNGCGSCEEVFTNVPNMSAMQQPMDQTSQYLVNSVSNSNSSQAHAANLVNNAMRQAGVINTTNGNTMLNATSNGANHNIQPQQPSKPPVRKAEQVMETLEQCLTTSSKFLTQGPDEFDAKLIAASCSVVAPGTKS